MARTFYAPLLHNLTDVHGATGTFTRATDATVPDHTGILRTVRSGEARFWGARRVENLVLQSEFVTGWTGQNATLDQAATTAPDGTSTGVRLNITTVNSYHNVWDSWTVFKDKQDYVVSIYMKDDGATYGGINFGDSTSVDFITIVANLTTGEITDVELGSGSGTVYDYGSEDVGNGWYRIWMSGTFEVPSSGVGYFQPFSSNVAVPSSWTSGKPTYTGVEGEDIFIWGLQAEVAPSNGDFGGSYGGVRGPSEYLSTTTAIVTEYYPYTLSGWRKVENLCLQSEDFSTTWTNANTTESTNTTTAPDGLSTADTLAEDGTAAALHGIDQQFSFAGVPDNTDFITSVFVKSINRDWVWLAQRNKDGSSDGCYFNVTTGVVGVSTADDQGMEAIGNGWWRCWVKGNSHTGGTNGTVWIYIAEADNDRIFDGQSQDSLYIWGAQRELFNEDVIPGEYQATTTTSEFELYHDVGSEKIPRAHAAGDLGMRGYIGEAPATNLALQSEDISTTWVLDRSTASTNAIVAPDGSTSADGIIADTQNDEHIVRQSITLTAAEYCFSVYAKPGDQNWIKLRINELGREAFFDIANGTIGTEEASTTGFIEELPNGWYRCSIIFTGTAASANCRVYCAEANNDTFFAGDNSTVTTYVWGMQCELSDRGASTYIPTTTSTVTRNRDVLNYSDDLVVDNAQGAYYFETQSFHEEGTTRSWLSIWTGAVRLAYTNAGAATRLVFDGTNSSSTTHTESAFTTERQAARWDDAGTGTLQKIVDGTVDSTPGNFDGSWDRTTDIFYVGGQASANTIGGTICEVSVWNQDPGETDLDQYTTDGFVPYDPIVFHAPLIKDLIDTKGSTDDFNRASVAHVTDHDGILREVVSEEPRFWGTRRVENILLESETFNVSPWVASGITVTANDTTAPDGTTTADHLDNVDGTSDRMDQSITLKINTTYIYSCYIKNNDTTTGNWQLRVDMPGSIISQCAGTWTGVSSEIPLTTLENDIDFSSNEHVGNDWYRISMTFTTGSTSGSTTVRLYPGFGPGNANEGIWAWGAQLEEVGGASLNSRPGEYQVTTTAAASSVYDHTLSYQKTVTNLFLQSEALGTSPNLLTQATITANDIVAPDGTTTADKLVEDNTAAQIHRVRQEITGPPRKQVAFSIYAKADEREHVQLFVFNDTDTANYFHAVFDLVDEVVDSSGSAGDGTFVGSSLRILDDGWCRCTIVGIADINAGDFDDWEVQVRLHNGSSSVYDGDNSSGLHIWGGQLERVLDDDSTDYIPTTTTEVSRIDQVAGNSIPLSDAHGDLGLKGYVSEIDKTNLCLQSEDLSTTWSASNTTITTNDANSPDGSGSADDMAHTTSGGQLSQNITVAADTEYTFSFYVKSAAHDWVLLQYKDSAAANGIRAWFDLTNSGQVGTSEAFGTGATLIGTTVERLPNDWYRVSVSGELATTITSGQVIIINTTADNVTTAETTNSVWWWGGQLEIQRSLTSYISTTTSSVTRSKDELTYDEPYTISDIEGAAYVEFTPVWGAGLSAAGEAHGVIISHHTATETGPMYVQAGTSVALAIFDGTNFSGRGVATVPYSLHRLATRWSTVDNEVQVSNGGLTDATPASFDSDWARAGDFLVVGGDGINMDNPNGCLRNVVIWDNHHPTTTINKYSTEGLPKKEQVLYSNALLRNRNLLRR